MEISHLTETVDIPEQELYHWTSGEHFRRILTSSVLRGNTPIEYAGRQIEGTSTTRNPFFDIMATYAVAGNKPWRLGFSKRKLSNDHKIIPYRDPQYRDTPKTLRRKEDVLYGFKKIGTKTVSSDESEELVVGDVYPIWHYMTSLGLDARYLDTSYHPTKGYFGDADPEDVEAEYDEWESKMTQTDQHILFNIMAGTFYGRDQYKQSWGAGRKAGWRLPPHIKVYWVDVNGNRQWDFGKFHKQNMGFSDDPHSGENPYWELGSDDERGERGDYINQRTKKFGL